MIFEKLHFWFCPTAANFVYYQMEKKYSETWFRNYLLKGNPSLYPRHNNIDNTTLMGCWFGILEYWAPLQNVAGTDLDRMSLFLKIEGETQGGMNRVKQSFLYYLTFLLCLR